MTILFTHNQIFRLKFLVTNVIKFQSQPNILAISFG